jgi:UDP-GlcNAc3NAcA epimerase
MIYHIVGTRPNLIKCAELVKQIRGEQVVVYVDQHKGDMAEPFLPSGVEVVRVESKNRVGAMAEAIYEVCGMGKYVVYGDCRSSLAGAMVAFEYGPLYHVEAGLRCGNMSMKEEKARRAIDGMAYRNFCPSSREKKNVENGVVTGDIMYDIFLREKSNVDLMGYQNYVLVTLHRAELLYSADFVETLSRIVWEFKGREILWLQHPHSKDILKMKTGSEQYRGITCLAPANHLQTLGYIKGADYVVTDSGGVSKEACWFGKKLGVVRLEESEWGIPKLQKGWTKEDFVEWKLDSGDGHAAEKISGGIE